MDIELLEQLKRKLAPSVENVSMRGEGSGSFLFIEGNGCAIEASRNGNHWWVEFWDRSETEDELPVKELTLDTNEDVFLAVTEWLK